MKVIPTRILSMSLNLKCNISELLARAGSNMLCTYVNAMTIDSTTLHIGMNPAFNESSKTSRFKHSDSIEIHNRIVFYQGLPHVKSTNTTRSQ